jgi:hypothetical protein
MIKKTLTFEQNFALSALHLQIIYQFLFTSLPKNNLRLSALLKGTMVAASKPQIPGY